MWDNLKASIASVVRTNNNQEITGANLQNVLNTIVNTVGANATFAGIAVPSTNPGTPDGPVFYIACEPGVYSNFNLTLVDGLYILENKTGSWVGIQINTGAAFEALIGYYNAVLNGASITVPEATTYRLTKGGVIRLKMLAPGTTATTLTIGNATNIPIWYNGAAVSAQNTWEADEIISVFYDGTRFMASNSQGGGGKFGSGEKVKDVGITDDVTVNDDNLVTSGGVYKDTPSNVTSPNNCDLDFADPLGNVLVSFEDGHVKTKEFDSSVDAPTRAAAAPYGDLEFADSEGNVLVSFENGGIKTKKFDSNDIANNPWKNKKIAWDGHSAIYGSNVDDRTKIFPYIVTQNLNATYVNYAIGGSTICKKPDSYEDIFYSLEEWQTATGAGLVDTTKKYLVRDGAFGAKRPYGLYSYSNGSWSAPAVAYRNGENCARTPLVDRIQELPTDADLVVIGIGANDWAHEWGSLGTPYVNGVRNMDKTTVCGAMNIVCQYLTETYINNETKKRVLFITECPSFHYMEDVSVLNPYTEKWGMTYYEFVELLTEIAGNYGIPYWNIMREMGLSSYESWWVSSQDITSHRKSHPNVAGHARVAEILTRMVLQF